MALCFLCAIFLIVPSPTFAQHVPVPLTITQDIVFGAGADELFERVRFGVLLDDGRAAVADAGGPFVRIYGRDGERVAEFGRRGAGPGEFQSINGLWVTSDGHLATWDAALARITVFDPDDGAPTTFPVTSHGMVSGNLEVFFGVFSNDEILLTVLRFGNRESPREVVADPWIIGRFTGQGEFVERFATVSGFLRAGARRTPIPFTPVPRIVVHRDEVWIAHPTGTEIDVRSQDGEHTKTIELPDFRRSFDIQDARAALRAQLEARDEEFFLTQLDQMPLHGSVPAIGGFVIDSHTGDVWVKEYDPTTDSIWIKRSATEPGRGGRWHILTEAGTPKGTVELPSHVALHDVRGGRLLVVAYSEWDEERVERWRIERTRD